MIEQTTYYDYKAHKIKVEIQKAEHSLWWNVRASCKEVVDYTFVDYCKHEVEIDKSVAYVVGKIKSVINTVLGEKALQKNQNI